MGDDAPGLAEALAELAEELGCSAVDTGSSRRGTPHTRFVQAWACRERPVCSWPSRGGGVDFVSPLGALIRHLPLSIARAVGPALRRRIP